METRLALLAAALLTVLSACGPIGPFPGGRLFGDVVPGPVEDWSFSDAYQTIAVETRPGFPHSITTICFTHEGQLYVPALRPQGKRWPFFVLENSHVRLKIGDKIYLGRANRVLDESAFESLRASAQKKYPQLGEQDPESLPEIWVFRIDPVG